MTSVRKSVYVQYHIITEHTVAWSIKLTRLQAYFNIFSLTLMTHFCQFEPWWECSCCSPLSTISTVTHTLSTVKLHLASSEISLEIPTNCEANKGCNLLISFSEERLAVTHRNLVDRFWLNGTQRQCGHSLVWLFVLKQLSLVGTVVIVSRVSQLTFRPDSHHCLQI